MRRDEAIPIFGGVYFNETWFYPLLAGLSPFLTREMGRDWAKDPPVHIGPWPELNQRSLSRRMCFSSPMASAAHADIKKKPSI